MNESEYRRHTEQALRETALWVSSGDSGRLQISDKPSEWLNPEQILDEVPSERGIYCIGLRFGVTYDYGTSRIIYIGESSNLRRRLSGHRNDSNSEMINALSEKFPDDLVVMPIPIPAIKPRFRRGIEFDAICEFERKFGIIPLGIRGGNDPETLIQRACRDLIAFEAAESTDAPMPIEELASSVGRHVNRVERVLNPHGIDMPQVAVIEFGATPTKPRQFKMALFPVVAWSSHESDWQVKREHEALTRIDAEHVAIWNKDKFTELLKICAQLSPTKSRSTVHRFEVPDRKVPLPHTWGEVALVQARVLAGTWDPDIRVWVKLLHGMEVLGEAKLDDNWFYGLDHGESPQNSERRATVYDQLHELAETSFQSALGEPQLWTHTGDTG